VGNPTNKAKGKLYMPLKVVKQYNTKLDSKKRMTIRNPHYEHYEVSIFETGHILLKPKVLVDAKDIPVKTLKMLRKSVSNLKKGKSSKPINIKKYLEIAEHSG
jgi:hypothetical protein